MGDPSAPHYCRDKAFGLLKVVVDLAALAADKTMWGASHNDGVCVDTARNVWRGSPVPDLTTVYLWGADSYAHGRGLDKGQGKPGESAAPTVREYLVKGLDKRLQRMYDCVVERGYEQATFFVVVADHGEVALLSGGKEADKYRPLLQKDRGDPTTEASWELLRVFQGTSYAGSVYTGGSWEARRVVFSPNGGLSHVYLRRESKGWNGEPPNTAPTNERILEVAKALYEANESSTDAHVRGSIAEILVKARIGMPEGANSFVQEYLWYHKQDGLFETLPLQQLQAKHANWPQLIGRVDGLNDKTATGSNSGDIVIIWATDKGYSSEYGKNHGSHGGVTKPEVEVPLVFGSPLMQRSLKPDPADPQAAARAAFNIKFMDDAVKAVREQGRSVPSNSDMTPILLDVVKACRTGRP